MGSGAGLVLLLVSCFSGEESAMELWLLLSSVCGKEKPNEQGVTNYLRDA